MRRDDANGWIETMDISPPATFTQSHWLHAFYGHFPLIWPQKHLITSFKSEHRLALAIIRGTETSSYYYLLESSEAESLKGSKSMWYWKMQRNFEKCTIYAKNYQYYDQVNHRHLVSCNQRFILLGRKSLRPRTINSAFSKQQVDFHFTLSIRILSENIKLN